MSAANAADLLRHKGHEIEIAAYGSPVVNVAVECLTCGEVITEFDAAMCPACGVPADEDDGTCMNLQCHWFDRYVSGAPGVTERAEPVRDPFYDLLTAYGEQRVKLMYERSTNFAREARAIVDDMQERTESAGLAWDDSLIPSGVLDVMTECPSCADLAPVIGQCSTCGHVEGGKDTANR